MLFTLWICLAPQHARLWAKSVVHQMPQIVIAMIRKVKLLETMGFEI